MGSEDHQTSDHQPAPVASKSDGHHHHQQKFFPVHFDVNTVDESNVTGIILINHGEATSGGGLSGQMSPKQLNIATQHHDHHQVDEADERTQAERDVLNFVASTTTDDEGGIRSMMVRSNSYTLQDVEKQRKSIQASLEAGISAEDDPTYRYFHTVSNLKGRRFSKSLPELNHLRLFPLMATQYSGGGEGLFNGNGTYDGDEDDDDESRIGMEANVKTAWASKSEFIFTGISLALGLNNIWRFPYFCYKFNGGSFLLAYVLCMIFFGVPILSMEYALGQLTRRGPIAAFGSLCPLLKGVPVGAAFITIILAPIYSTINSWSMFYFFKSFYSNPLWSKCGNSWNTKNCSSSSDVTSSPVISSTDPYNISLTTDDYLNSTADSLLLHHYPNDQHNHKSNDNHNISSGHHETIETIEEFLINGKHAYGTQEFFDLKLLELDLEANGWGNVQWELIIFVFVTWFTVFVTLRKNILFSSHPSSCITLAPYAFLGVFFARSLMFEGSKKGIIFFFKPNWTDIHNPELWLYAAGLGLHSLCCVLGTSFAKATCNRERNNFLR